jgi:UDP-N-acetyl-2-amino-2-deoxyglucuronate dehydrogenase
MNTNTKVLILGAGRVFKHYLYILKKYKIKNYEIVAIVDKKKIDKSIINLKKIYFRSLKEALNQTKPDLAIILTPSGLHYKHSKYFLKKGINVLCEKPLALLPNQVIELGKLANKKKLLYDVVFQNRFNPSLNFAKKLILKKKLGKIITFSVRVFWCRFSNYYKDGWHGTWAMDGGVLSQQAIHHLDAINWLIGPIFKTFSLKKRMLNKLEAEDTISCLLETSNGTIGTFQATTAARPSDKVAEITLVGEKGYLSIGGVALNMIDDIEIKGLTNKEISRIKKKNNQKVINGYGFSHAIVLDKTFKNLKQKKISPLVGFKNASYTQQIIQTIYKSTENKTFYKVQLKNKSKLGRK